MKDRDRTCFKARTRNARICRDFTFGWRATYRCLRLDELRIPVVPRLAQGLDFEHCSGTSAFSHRLLPHVQAVVREQRVVALQQSLAPTPTLHGQSMAVIWWS